MPTQPKRRHPRRKSALRLTIGRRLALAVLVAGLLAVAAVLALGVRSLQLMRQQSTVYQHLIAANDDLASGEYYLQLLQDKLNQAVSDAQASGLEPAILTSDTVAVQRLENQYDLTLANYVQSGTLSDHPQDVRLLTWTHIQLPLQEQQLLTQSAKSSWRTYDDSINAVLQDLQNNDLADAQVALAGDVERAHTNASSILRSLQETSQKVAVAAENASAALGKQTLIVMLAGAFVVFALIAIAGAALAVSPVRRLRKLTNVTRAVEAGRLDQRAETAGTDEIAAVAQSMNNMLDTIGVLMDDACRREQREHENVLRSFFESSPLLMGILALREDDLVVESANTFAARVYRRTPQEIAGQALSALGMPPRVLDLWLDRCHQAHETMRPVRFEYPRVLNGEELWYNATVAPIATESGENPRISFIIDDVTELKRSEQRLRQLSAAAVESARLKSEFLANMSHEIRTPMNGIMGMTELLLETPLGDDQRDYASTVHDSAQALLTILNDILDFSKIEAGKLDLEHIDFEPRVVVESVADLLSPKAAEKHLALMTYIAPDAPSAVRGDPSRLRQILLNLVGNAIKFTTRGDVVVRVTLTEPTEQSGRATVRFTVSDTGIGLSENARQRLFQPFTQADGSTTRQYGGTGLGLSICRRLVELMGGDIAVESAEGQGSSFWFSIPFEAAQTAPSAPAHPVVAPQRLAGRRVLVIDDNRAHRAILQNYFSAWGLRGAEASDAAAGLVKLREAASQGAPFEAAVVDYMMPGMDGMATAHAILADPAIRSTRLILLTAFDEVGLGQQALQAGFSAYLTKPVKQLSLVDALARALDALTPEELAARRMRGQPKPATASVAADASKPRQRLLLAEDNAVNQKLALLQLERLGYQVDVAGNGRQALTMLSQRRYALVLMDCHMPEMDGYEATVAIRASEAPTGTRLPIIAMTANALQGDQDRCIAAGMDDYLSKPVTLDGLRKKLDQWMPTEEVANEPAILRGYGAHERHDEATPASPPPTDGKLSPASAPHPIERTEPESDALIARSPSLPTDAGVIGDARPTSETSLAAPFRILLVDDNSVNLKLTSLQLRRLGCVVDVAANGREALDMLARHQYALVLMDCNMPVMDGYEATRAIRSNEAATGSHLPVIAVTANALSGDREVCIEAGMDDYLPKPVKLHALKSLIEQWAPNGKEPRTDQAATAPSDSAPRPATPPPFAVTPVAMPAPKTDQAVSPVTGHAGTTGDQGDAVDMEQLDAIRALQEPGAPDVVTMVVDEFRMESRDLLRTMACAQASGDAKELHRAAHSLKSSSAYLGAQRLSSVCANLESLAKTGMTPGAATQRYVSLAEEEYERVLTALASALAPDGSGAQPTVYAG